MFNSDYDSIYRSGYHLFCKAHLLAFGTGQLSSLLAFIAIFYYLVEHLYLITSISISIQYLNKCDTKTIYPET